MQPLALPHLEYDGNDVGQVIEDFRCFSESLITDIANEYWLIKVMGTLDKSQAFYLASHRLGFTKKMAQVAKEIILVNKKPGRMFAIRECGFGNGVFALRFLG